MSTINGNFTLGPCIIKVGAAGEDFDTMTQSIGNKDGGVKVEMTPELYKLMNDEQPLPQSATFVKVDCAVKFVTDNTEKATVLTATGAYLEEATSGVLTPLASGTCLDANMVKVICRPVGETNDANDFILEYALNNAAKTRNFMVSEKEQTEFVLECYSGANGSFKYNLAKPQA